MQSGGARDKCSSCSPQVHCCTCCPCSRQIKMLDSQDSCQRCLPLHRPAAGPSGWYLPTIGRSAMLGLEAVFMSVLSGRRVLVASCSSCVMPVGAGRWS